MQKNLSQIDEIGLLIKSKYPIIYIVSWEENRIEAMLIKLSNQMKKKIFLWSVASGLYTPSEKPRRTMTEPLTLLDHIPETEPSSIFILKDFSPWFNDPRLVRKLRDLIGTLRNSHKTLIILSPELVIPLPLEKDVTVIDFKLPGMDELADLFDRVYDTASVDSKIELCVHKDNKEKFARACLGLTLTEAENAFARAIAMDSAFTDQDLDIILDEKKQIIRKSRFLEYFEAGTGMFDVGGVTLLKKWLKNRMNVFGDKAKKFGLPEPKGLLLFGIQGCGKSLICKAIANMWKMPLLRLDMGAIFGMYVGLSESNMRKAIKTAESVSPCVLWVDELEKGFSGIGSSDVSDAGTTARVISTFLTWMQEKTVPVFIAATSNNIFSLPPEILRKGRFDEIFFVDLPAQEEQKEIFKIHLEKRNRKAKDYDIDELVKYTAGFSGAEIEQSIIDGLYTAFSEKRQLNTDDILKAIQVTVPLSRTMEEVMDSLRKWAKARARFASVYTKKQLGIGFHKE